MKKMIGISIALTFCCTSPAFSNDRTYTNTDLQRYEGHPGEVALSLKAAKISVDFQDANVYQVLRIIAEVAKKKDDFDVFVSSDISGKITIKMIDVPWTEALQKIMQQYNLAATNVGKQALVIYPKK